MSSVRVFRWTSALCIALPHLINTLWGLGGNTSKYVAVFFIWQLMFIGSELYLCMLSTYLGLFAFHVVTKASVACVCNPAAHLKADSHTRADSCSVCCWPQLVQMNVLCCSSWCDLCNTHRFARGCSDTCWGWFPVSLVSCDWAMNDRGPCWVIQVLGLLFSKVLWFPCKFLCSAEGLGGCRKDRNFLGGNVRWCGPSGRREVTVCSGLYTPRGGFCDAECVYKI